MSKSIEPQAAPPVGSSALLDRLDAAMDALRACIPYLPGDAETRELLWHAGQTLKTIKDIARAPSLPMPGRSNDQDHRLPPTAAVERKQNEIQSKA